jgi:peptidoglycan/LPS O-acetylase OafA/YrhL
MNCTEPGLKVQQFLSENSGPWGWLLMIIMVSTFTAWLSPLLWNAVVPGGWSIQSEIFHYLAFAILRRFKTRTVLILLVGVNVVTFSLIQLGSTLPFWLLSSVDAWVRLGLFSTFFYFALGVVSYMLFSDLSSGKQLIDIAKSLSGFEWALSVIYVVTVLTLPLTSGNNAEAAGFVFLALGVGFAIQRIRFLVPFFTVLGRYSYFLYFMHFLVLFGSSKILLRLHEQNIPFFNSSSVLFLIFLVVVFSFSLPAAWLSNRYFEAPILRLARGGKRTLVS